MKQTNICRLSGDIIISMAGFSTDPSDSLWATVLGLSAILGWRTPEQAAQSCYKTKADRLFQHQLAWVVSENIGGMQPWIELRSRADPTSSRYWYEHQATWMAITESMGDIITPCRPLVDKFGF